MQFSQRSSHDIALYQENCKQVDYNRLSYSTLYQILNSTNLSQKKSLTGLDDKTAAGITGFETLQKIARNFKSQECNENLESSKRYLKTRYMIHCSDPDTNIVSHCSKYALSDRKNQNLQSSVNISIEVCKECMQLCDALQAVRQLATKYSASDDVFYDIDISMEHILDYIKHIMRDSQQKKAKIDAFEKIDDEIKILAQGLLSKDPATEIS